MDSAMRMCDVYEFMQSSVIYSVQQGGTSDDNY